MHVQQQAGPGSVGVCCGGCGVVGNGGGRSVVVWSGSGIVGSGVVDAHELGIEVGGKFFCCRLRLASLPQFYFVWHREGCIIASSGNYSN